MFGRTGALAFLRTPGRTAVSLLGAYAHTASAVGAASAPSFE
ncbi:hypothetical protein [Nonomuraea dietziae]